jgi:hypothetical protein
MPGDIQSQGQSQSVTINVNSSGDPELESRILNGKHGVGRQLGALSDVVAVLLAAHENAAVPAGAADAFVKFKQVQADIAEEKRRREPSRLLEELEAAEGKDASESLRLCQALREWLGKYEAALPVTTALQAPIGTEATTALPPHPSLAMPEPIAVNDGVFDQAPGAASAE